MAPPSYYELGYQARDIFNKHYRKEFILKLALKGKHSDGNIKCNQILTVKNNLGFVKLDVRTITSSGLEFNVHGSSNSETNKTFANVDASYTLNKCGLTLKKKLDSDNNITVELSHRDKLIKGLTLGGRRSIVLNGSQRGTIFAKCRGDLVNLSTDVDFDPAGSLVNGTAVIGSKEFLIGSQVTYDPNLRKMIKTNFSAGYGTHDYAVHGSLNEKYDFNGSIYNKVNESLESAVSVGWSADNSSTKLALGCVYQLDSTSTVRAKINNNSQFSLGFSHILRPGIVISLSSMFDLKNLNGGGHKIGMGIELNQT